MNYLKKIYGIDLLSLLILFLSSFFNFSIYTSFISLALLIVALIRIFSTNRTKRQAENNKLIGYLNRFLGRFNVRIPYNSQPIDYVSISYLYKIAKNKVIEKKNYKITKCPRCSQKLRLPRKKGSIIVTCKRCSNKFDFRT